MEKNKNMDLWWENAQKIIEKFREMNHANFLNGSKFFLMNQGFNPWKLGNFWNKRISKKPSLLMEMAAFYMAGINQLGQAILNGTQGKPIGFPKMRLISEGKRFSHTAWEKHPLFISIKCIYLTVAHMYEKTIENLPELSSKEKRTLEFYVKQLLEAFSPNNFLFSNPEALQKAGETGGESLYNGYKKFLEDLQKGKGSLKIRTSCDKTFAVGKNIAQTEGKVIYQNDLIQLIQYKPLQSKSYSVPLFIVPPWINKFYIFDLQPHNSFVQWALQQGHQVFIISWVNPTAQHAHKGFEDYLREGFLAALDVIQKNTKANKVNVLGYCIGGTLVNCALAYLKSVGDERVQSATLLTTLTDFTSVGDLGVFVEEEYIRILEKYMDIEGYFNGYDLNQLFNFLAPHKMVWPFFVNNYLLNKDIQAFDILYWNSDYVHLPAAMKKFILRHMYLENSLVKPGGINLLGIPIDLRCISVPIFLFSTKEDHIAPWDSTYKATQFYKGPVTFMLGGSGHTAGVINAPQANKYSYWINNVLPSSPEEWFEKSTEHKGSWWTEWEKWLKPFSGSLIESGPLYQQSLSLEKAPGSYALKRTV